METQVVMYAVSVITAVICVVMAYFILDEEKAAKIKILHKMGHGEAYEKVTFSKKTYWTLLIFASLAVLATCYYIATRTTVVLDFARLCITLICLTGAAANDVREHRIPNIFPAVLALGGILCLVLGYLTSQQGWMAYIASCTIATVATALCFGFAFFISKHGIGMGDIKILCALALAMGVYATCGTIFFGIVSCAVLSVVLLIIKKKGFKDTLPFGPFIFLGFVISVLMGIY
ncbi:MAG: prepilin peptidase [Acetatifactor sp.]|nr:prepilin peptidase [Acetatifactor sp.]